MKNKPQNIKVALVHDYLCEYGGAEMVVEDLHTMFPQAPIYTFYFDPKGLNYHYKRIKEWNIVTSIYQKIPFARRSLSPSRLIAPFIFQRFDLSSFDVVISSSNHHSAKAVKTMPHTLHLSYIHTPPKMLYGYTTSFNYKKHWYTRIGAEVANHLLRVSDYRTAQNPTILIANSQTVQKRIKKFYRRDATVVYPGVDLDAYRQVKKTDGEYFLSLNRLVKGKGTEIVVSACTALNIPLKVAGSGPELEKLKSIAGPTIEFLGHVKEEEKPALFANAKALIVAAEQEDFGITPIEAMAAGTPVIAARSGGFLETIIEGVTGEFFYVPQDLNNTKEYVNSQALSELKKVLKSFNTKKYKGDNCRKQAEKFSKQKFRQNILNLIDKNFPLPQS